MKTKLKKNKVIICASVRYKANKILDYFDNEKIVLTNEDEIQTNYINVIIKKINEGFTFNDLFVINEAILFNQKKEIVYKNSFRFGTKIRDLNKLNIGDYVVHSAHGLARYAGIKTLF